MHLVSIFWVAGLSWAEPLVPPEDSGAGTTTSESSGELSDSAPPSPNSFESVLRAAKERHFAGESVAARNLLVGLSERLEAGEDPGEELAVEAMTYLGEVHHKLDERSEARAAFRWILERDPETPISPFHHSFDVVNLFDLVRAEVLREQDVVPPPDPGRPKLGPPPLWTFAPLGIPQLAQRRPGAFLLFGGLQAGFGVASLVVYRDLTRLNVERPRDTSPAEYEAFRNEVRQRRLRAQWPLTFAFYGTWALSMVDASGQWRRRQIEAQVGVGLVGPGTPGVRFTGTF